MMRARKIYYTEDQELSISRTNSMKVKERKNCIYWERYDLQIYQNATYRVD